MARFQICHVNLSTDIPIGRVDESERPEYPTLPPREKWLQPLLCLIKPLDQLSIFILTSIGTRNRRMDDLCDPTLKLKILLHIIK